MKHPEDALQISVVNTLRLCPDLRVVAVPNGGKRGVLEAARMRRAGVLAGVSDLLVFWAPGRVALIELKAPGKVTGQARPLRSLSPAQLVWLNWCQASGFPATVADSLEAVLEFLRRQGAPVAARAQGGFAT
ncbi:VRR-NUC domain-containing protein [Pararhodospirillum photometricum]|nr:VRR-NUC domain-containing protein [Pararhodospirillum photometricum]